MRTWMALACAGALSFASGSCNAQEPLDQAGFRDAVAREISALRPNLCVRLEGEAEIAVGRSEENCDEARVSVAYIYRQYSSDTSNQTEYIGGLVRTAMAAIAALDQGSFAPVRERIVAVLRPTEYAEGAGLRGDPQSSIWRPFAGDLIALLAQYDDGQVRSLRAVDLRTVGLTESQAWELAIANLRQLIGPLSRAHNAYGAESVSAPSGLAPASLLLPETCASAGPDFDVYVVQRDTFFYADTNNQRATAMLAGYAAELLQGDQVYSQRLLSCLDGRWHSSVFNNANAWVPEPTNRGR